MRNIFTTNITVVKFIMCTILSVKFFFFYLCELLVGNH